MGFISREVEIFGKTITIETGKMAKQADGSALVSCGGTAVIATAVAGDEARPFDFLPLTVDVEEKLYAAGKIPGSFFKREGRPTDSATLTARLIDRTIRPNFNKDFRNEAQVVCTVLASDSVNPPDMLAFLAACCALSFSDIPCAGPLAGVRVANVDDNWVINPDYEQIGDSAVNLIVAGDSDAIMMVEAGSSQIPEAQMVKALEAGHNAIGQLCEVIRSVDGEYREASGRPAKAAILGEIQEYLDDQYRKTAAGLVSASSSGDPEAIAAAADAHGSVSSVAAEHFENRYRKFVSILSDIAAKATVYELVAEAVEPLATDALAAAIKEASAPDLRKSERDIIRKDVRKRLTQELSAKYPTLEGHVKEALGSLERSLLRKQIIEDKIRPDGRKSFQIRKLTTEVGLLPTVHGSALFTRGETQVLSIVTLGAHGEKQILDDLGIADAKRYLHHYNFPPFCTGEARPLRGPKRREIGHGALAERAVFQVVPDQEDFPYTIRVVSEVLESNGSSSMGSTCASSMALMDAGVPLKEGLHVGGIAMGLIKEGDQFVILSDIIGLEDSMGDMDFKVTGTREGITALQMDIKCDGLTFEIMEAALEQARQGRNFIIKAMSEAIDEPRSEVSANAPKMLQLQIPVAKIGELIGPGGKNIRALIEKYEVEIDVEDDGQVFVFGKISEKVNEVRKVIEMIAKDPEVGERYNGKVVKTTNFGAFVELKPGKDGLVHISKLSKTRINAVEDVVNVGQIIEVEVEEIDSTGRISLKVINLNPGDD